MRFIHPSSAFLSSTRTSTIIRNSSSSTKHTTTTTTTSLTFLPTLVSSSNLITNNQYHQRYQSCRSYSTSNNPPNPSSIYVSPTTTSTTTPIPSHHSRMMMSTTGNNDKKKNNNNNKNVPTGKEMMKSLIQYKKDELHIEQPELIGLQIPHSIEALINADCVCFDVDSTVIQEEGIDVLADYLGKGNEVAQLTKQAMEGDMKFQDALSLRLQLLQPSQLQIESCLRDHPFQFTNGIVELMQLLQLYHKDIYLISGGFRIMIEPIAMKLNIHPKTNVIANTIYFDSDLLYNGFDMNEYTSQDMGKARAIQSIIDRNPLQYRTIVMIGDGMTDAQTKPPATTFIGFGGVITRPNVQQIADWFITDFHDLIYLLNTYCGGGSSSSSGMTK